MFWFFDILWASLKNLITQLTGGELAFAIFFAVFLLLLIWCRYACKTKKEAIYSGEDKFIDFI